MKTYIVQLRGTLEKRFQPDSRGDGSPITYLSIREAVSAIWNYHNKGCSFDWRIVEKRGNKSSVVPESELLTSIGETGFSQIKPLLTFQ